MENAVKALLIAAGVLLGLLMLSLAVSLYSSLSSFVSTVQGEIVSKEVQKFNEQFVKYINCDTLSENANFTLTIHDIITAANTAYESNEQYELTKYENNNFYVTINLDTKANIEKNIIQNSAELLSQELGQEFKCSREDIKINEFTGRVYEVKFHKITTET